MQRGKDGHLTLNAVGTGDDFFSNPLGGGNLSGRQGSLGACGTRQAVQAFMTRLWGLGPPLLAQCMTGGLLMRCTAGSSSLRR